MTLNEKSSLIPLDIKAHRFSGYDHVISIHERAFNAKFKTYFRWCKCQEDDKSFVFPLEWKNHLKEPVSDVMAEFGSVIMELIESEDNKSVNIILPLIKGKFTYWMDDRKNEIDINKWTVKIRAHLGFSNENNKPPHDGYEYDIETFSRLETIYHKVQVLYLDLKNSSIVDASFDTVELKSGEKELFLQHAEKLAAQMHSKPRFNLIFMGVTPRKMSILSPAYYLTPGHFGYSIFVKPDQPNQSAIHFPFLSCQSVRTYKPPNVVKFKKSFIENEAVDGVLILDGHRLFAWLLWYIIGRQVNTTEDAVFFTYENNNVTSLWKTFQEETLHVNFQARKPDAVFSESIPPVCPLRYNKFSFRSQYVLDIGGQQDTFTLAYMPDSFDVDIDMRIKTTHSAASANGADIEYDPTGTVEIVVLSSQGNPGQGKFLFRQNKEKEQVVEKDFEECLKQGRLTETMHRKLAEQYLTSPFYKQIVDLYENIAKGGKRSMENLSERAGRLAHLKQGMALNLSQVLFYLALPGGEIFTFQHLRLDEEWNLKLDIKFQD